MELSLEVKVKPVGSQEKTVSCFVSQATFNISGLETYLLEEPTSFYVAHGLKIMSENRNCH